MCLLLVKRLAQAISNSTVTIDQPTLNCHAKVAYWYLKTCVRNRIPLIKAYPCCLRQPKLTTIRAYIMRREYLLLLVKQDIVPPFSPISYVTTHTSIFWEKRLITLVSFVKNSLHNSPMMKNCCLMWLKNLLNTLRSSSSFCTCTDHISTIETAIHVLMRGSCLMNPPRQKLKIALN